MTKKWPFAKITDILLNKLRSVIVSKNHYLNKILDVHPLSNTLDLQHVHMFIINTMIPMANTKMGDWIWTCEHVKDQKCLKFVRCFWCNSVSTKTSFVSCSCSELLQLKFGEKNNAGKCKLLTPQDSYRGD